MPIGAQETLFLLLLLMLKTLVLHNIFVKTMFFCFFSSESSVE